MGARGLTFKCFGVLGMLAASAAFAGPKTMTVAAGDCRNPELITATQTFTTAVAGRVGPDLLTSDAVLERFRPVPSLSSEELDRWLEAAQAQFYSGAYDKALESLRQVMIGIQRLSPRAQPWRLTTRALMLQAMVYKSAGKKNEAITSQKQLLRIEPAFALDADYYTPSAIQGFEALRKEVQQAKKVKLTIASTPSGAEVFLDGAKVGKTPFAGEYPLGDYRLALGAGEKLSFSRDLKLTRDEAVQVDLAFEGALSPQPPLCVTADPASEFDTALRLAALAGAENVVVLRLEARNNEPGWVTAVLLEVNKGTRVRDGGIRFTGARRAQALSDLAGFVLTGNPTAAVVATLGANPAPAAPAVAPEPAAPPTEPAVAAAPPVEVTAQRGSTRGILPRIAGIVLMGAGAIIAGTGGGIYASGGSDRAIIATLVDEQGRVRAGANVEEAKGVQKRIDGNVTTSLALAAAGGAAVLAGAAIFVLLPPTPDAPRVSVAPSADGIWLGATFGF